MIIIVVRALTEKHPDGQPIEVYIISSTNGCKQMHARAASLPHLVGRVDSLFIDLSVPGQPDEIDLARIPYYLYEKLDIRIVNHDGGRRVLKRFCQAKVLHQMNITLARQRSVWDVINTSKKLPQLTAEAVTAAKARFDSSAEIFFNNSFPTSETVGSRENGDSLPSGSIPRAFIPMSVISDQKDEVAVVTFDCRSASDF